AEDAQRGGGRPEELRAVLRLHAADEAGQPGGGGLGGQAQQADAADRQDRRVHQRHRGQVGPAGAQRRAGGHQGGPGGPRLLAGGRGDAAPVGERDALHPGDRPADPGDPRRHQRRGDGHRGGPEGHRRRRRQRGPGAGEPAHHPRAGHQHQRGRPLHLPGHPAAAVRHQPAGRRHGRHPPRHRAERGRHPTDEQRHHRPLRPGARAGGGGADLEPAPADGPDPPAGTDHQPAGRSRLMASPPTKLHAEIRERASTLITPGVISGIVGAVLAAYYTYLTIARHLPAGSGITFGLLILVTVAVCLAGLQWRARANLRALLSLARGREALQTALLQQAVKEALTVPEKLFRYSLLVWVVGGLTVGLGLKLLYPGVQLGIPGRFLAMALLFGPPTSLLGYCLMSLRARELVRVLCRAGLKADDAIAAFPPRRAQIRGRLVLFTAICVICPAALTADLSSTFARQGYAEVVKGGSESARRATAAEVRRAAMGQVAAMGLLVFGLAV